jgi:hypothetical protein
MRFSSCNFARIAQPRPGRNGSFGPSFLPLFQAGRRGVALDGLLSVMVGVLFKDLAACDQERATC